MGYTHYWRQKRDFADFEWTAIRIRTKAILGSFLDSGEKLDDITITDTICFNGRPGCETFILHKHKGERMPWVSESDYEQEGAFSFCKTRGRPYDYAVVAVLRAAKLAAPNAITLSSDGDVFDDLEQEEK